MVRVMFGKTYIFTIERRIRGIYTIAFYVVLRLLWALLGQDVADSFFVRNI